MDKPMVKIGVDVTVDVMAESKEDAERMVRAALESLREKGALVQVLTDQDHIYLVDED